MKAVHQGRPGKDLRGEGRENKTSTECRLFLSSPLLETQQYTNIHVSLFGYLGDLEEKREVMEAMGVATTTFNHVTNVSSNVREGGEERERERERMVSIRGLDVATRRFAKRGWIQMDIYELDKCWPCRAGVLLGQ